ncbi:MAG TPA: hypothetical protein EYP36_06755, partial [Calditrichaeota bacterium]|nr:hypothetical protein [Calditrichota bacterium]
MSTMLRKILFIILSLLCIGGVYAQTKIIEGLRISQSVHWSGTIIVRGDVVVTRGGRLVINPGTRVYFEANTDVSKSGKDKTKSELIIEGVVIARGDINNKILFSSKSDKPRMGDWYGITISNPKQISTFEYCTIEYAYNGIYAKKSNPQILNSHIRYNYNAGLIAAVQSEPVIKSSIISENGYAGLICELGARPVLSKNLITLNQLGIVSFSMSQPNLGNLKSGKDNNPGENRIFDNHDYNVYNHSSKDVIAQNNYWGSEVDAELQGKLYGKKDDPRYGKVLYKPVLGARQSLNNLVDLAPSAAEPANQPATETAVTQQPQAETGIAQNQDASAQEQADKNQTAASEDTVKLKHRTLDNIIGQFAVATSSQKSKEKPAPKVKKEEKKQEINYNQVF